MPFRFAVRSPCVAVIMEGTWHCAWHTVSVRYVLASIYILIPKEAHSRVGKSTLGWDFHPLDLLRGLGQVMSQMISEDSSNLDILNLVLRPSQLVCSGLSKVTAHSPVTTLLPRWDPDNMVAPC